MLKECFVVTMTSVYCLTVRDGEARAEKVVLKKESNFSMGHVLQRGTMLSIGEQLIAYFPDGGGFQNPPPKDKRGIEHVPDYLWGERTSKIVALFKAQQQAEGCLLENKDLKPYDPRWRAQTEAVLREIGDDHPVWTKKAALPSPAA